jgi:hypothetical protein
MRRPLCARHGTSYSTTVDASPARLPGRTTLLRVHRNAQASETRREDFCRPGWFENDPWRPKIQYCSDDGKETQWCQVMLPMDLVMIMVQLTLCFSRCFLLWDGYEHVQFVYHIQYTSSFCTNILRTVCTYSMYAVCIGPHENLSQQGIQSWPDWKISLLFFLLITNLRITIWDSRSHCAMDHGQDEISERPNRDTLNCRMVNRASSPRYR